MASGRRKLIAGCSIGCGVLLVGAVLAVLFGLRWFQKEAELPSGDHPLLTGEEVRYLTLTLDAGDEGQAALLGHLLREMAKQDLPDEMAMVEKILDTLSAQDPQVVLGQYLPIRFALLCYEAREGGEAGCVQVTGFTKSYQFLTWMLGQQMEARAESTEAYRGRSLSHNPDDGPVELILENRLIQGHPAGLVKSAVDRLLDGGASRLGPEAEELGEAVGRRSGRTDLWGYDLEAGALLADLYRSRATERPAAAPAVLERIEAAAAAVDVVSADAIRAKLALRFSPPPGEGDQAERTRLENESLAILSALLQPPLSPGAPASSWADGATLVMEGSVSGVSAYATGRVEALMKNLAAGPPPDGGAR